MIFTHVPPQWPSTTPCKIAFVGEAPSWEEIDKGQPLVGPSGRIFNGALRAANMSRSEYMITNVFDEKIPDNKIKNWCVPLKEAREQHLTDLPPVGANGFLSQPYRHHLDRLASELAKARPSVIVPLGATALWAFTGNTNIGSLRGTTIEATRLIPGAKIIPIYHPAFIMKKFNLLPVMVRDLLFAKSEADKGKEIKHAKRSLILEPTLRDIHNVMPRLLSRHLSSSSLSVDIETGWGQITCIGFAWDSEHAICIPFIDHRKPNKSYWSTPSEEAEAWRLVEQVLASPVPKLGQNFGGYDFMWLIAKYHLRVLNFNADTRLLSHAIYPELPKDLGFLGSSHSTQGAWKYMGKKGAKRDDQ